MEDGFPASIRLIVSTETPVINSTCSRVMCNFSRSARSFFPMRIIVSLICPSNLDNANHPVILLEASAAGGAEYAGKKGIAVSAGKRAANHHTHHLLRNELPMGIAPPAAGQLILLYSHHWIEKSTAFFKVVLH